MTEQPTSPADPNAGKQAAEQAEEYRSPFAQQKLTLDSGIVLTIPPHPDLRLLDDEALAALEKLNFELENCDREDDIYIPEQKVKDSAGNEITIPGGTQRGRLKSNPYRKTDKVTGEVTIMDPPYEVQVAKIALGEEDYATLRANNVNGKRGSSADVWRIWNKQGNEVGRRKQADSKSDGSSGGVADVATPDSQ